MNKSNKSNWYKLIWMVLIGLLLILGGVGEKMYMDYKHDEVLVHKAERIIATQLINSFTGVKEVKLIETRTSNPSIGGWVTAYKMQTSWSSQLSKGDQNLSAEVEYGNPRDPETPVKDIDILDGFVYGTQKSANVYDAHRGKTTTPVRVIYSNKQEETFNAK